MEYADRDPDQNGDSTHVGCSVPPVAVQAGEACPGACRRAINRVAALLELVDLGFEPVLTRQEEYRTHLPEIGLDEALNTEVLGGIFERFLPAKNADDEEPLAELLDQLGAFGVKTGRDVIELLGKHEVALRKAEAEALKDIESKGDKSKYRFDPDRSARGVFMTHVGLVQEALSREFGTRYDDYVRPGGGTRTIIRLIAPGLAKRGIASGTRATLSPAPACSASSSSSSVCFDSSHGPAASTRPYRR